MLISLAGLVAALAAAPARAQFEDDSFRRVFIDTKPVYIVPQDYAAENSRELIASIPGPPKVQGFWTPSETNVIVAERVFREYIIDAAKDPALMFPGLAAQTDANSLELLLAARNELKLIVANYPAYQQQYVGLVIDGKKIVYCNFSSGPRVDPSLEYVYIQRTFSDDGSIHFLQAEIDPFEKTASHVAYIGSWQGR